MSKNNNFLILFFCGLLLPIKSYGQKDSIKKFSLLNPVPSSQLREMETDRPDVTESPYTIDARHFQVETDLGRIIREKSESHQINTLLINQMNVKVGLTNSTAVQIGFQTYGRQSERKIDSDEKIIKHGNGDLTLRIKQNLIGNDNGKFVMAVLPYIKFATSNYEDSKFEGGLIIPMQYKLPGEWNLGFQVELDRLKDDDEQSMHTEFLQTLTISHAIVKGLDGIAETYYTYDFKAHQFSNFFNAAVQVGVTRDVKFDVGLTLGLQHTAAKNYFLGASFRL